MRSSVWFPGTWKIAWRLVRRSWARGDDQRAAKVASAYRRLRPKDPCAWDIWGAVLAKAGKDEEAERAARQALSMDTGSPRRIYSLATVIARQSRLEEAEALLEELKRSHPDSCFPYMGLADVARRRGEQQRAQAYAGDAIERSR